MIPPVAKTMAFYFFCCTVARHSTTGHILQNSAGLNKTEPFNVSTMHAELAFRTNKKLQDLSHTKLDKENNNLGEMFFSHAEKASVLDSFTDIENETAGSLQRISDTIHQVDEPRAFQKSFINLERQMRNITRPTGAKGAFYCDIIGQPIPQIQWIKDAKIMTEATGRIHIETGLWGSSLRVDQVRKSDEGTYTCMAINPSGAINATAYLRVTEKAKLPLAGKSNVARGHDEHTDIKSDGFCQDFHSNVCGKYLFGHQVFVTREYQQAIMETQISKFLRVSTTQPLHRLREKCLKDIMEVMCYYTFPVCWPSGDHKKGTSDSLSSSQLSGSGHKLTYPTLYLCRQDCQAIIEKECSSIYEHLSKTVLHEVPEMKLECSRLPPKSFGNTYSCRSIGQPIPNILQEAASTYGGIYSSNLRKEQKSKDQTETERQPEKLNILGSNVLPLFISVGTLLLVGTTLVSICISCRWNKGHLAGVRTGESSTFSSGFSRLNGNSVQKTMEKYSREQGVGGPKFANGDEWRLVPNIAANLKPLRGNKHPCYVDDKPGTKYSPSAISVIPHSEASVKGLSGCVQLVNEPNSLSSGQISQAATSNDISGSIPLSSQMLKNRTPLVYHQHPGVVYNSPPLPPPDAPAPPPPCIQLQCCRNTDGLIAHAFMNNKQARFYCPFTHGSDVMVSDSVNGIVESYEVSDSPTAYTTLRESSYNCSHAAHSPDSRFQPSDMFENVSYSQAELGGYQIHPTEYLLSQLMFGKQFGQGVFGPVYTAELFPYNSYELGSSLNVIVKTLSPGSPAALQADFQREAKLITELNHPNILSLFGVSMQNAPWCMIFEVQQYVDLCELLAMHRAINNPSTEISGSQFYETPLSDMQKLHILSQVSAGMEYLSGHRFVHRDLAARNVIILTKQLFCKITDLGLARDCYAADYYRMNQHSLMLPIRWMPLESILYGKFTVESDIWAFGVLMWEVWSGGLRPYDKYSDSEVLEIIKDKTKLQSPMDCPLEVYRFMLHCWCDEPDQRPCFESCLQQISKWHRRMTSRGNLKKLSACSSTDSSVTTAEVLLEQHSFTNLLPNEGTFRDNNFETLSFTHGSPINIYHAKSPNMSSVNATVWVDNDVSNCSNNFSPSENWSSPIEYLLPHSVKVDQNGGSPIQPNCLHNVATLEALSGLPQANNKFVCTSPTLGNFGGIKHAPETIT